VINFEKDSSGRSYQIWKQDQENSCGIASCMMVRSIAFQMSLAESEWAYAVGTFAGAVGISLGARELNAEAPMSLDPNAFPVDDNSLITGMGAFGFLGTQLADALRAEGLKVFEFNLGGKAIRIDDKRISATKPAIALVNWSTIGAHFLAVGRATPNRVSYLDPWTGKVNEQPNNSRFISTYGKRGTVIQAIYVSA
jgi:hypothetical protein